MGLCWCRQCSRRKVLGGTEVKSLEHHSVRFSSSFWTVLKEAACQMLGAMPILGRVFLAIDEGSLGSTLEHF